MTKPLLKGVLKTWKGDRGFGFLTPDHGGRDVFIHISAIKETSRLPKPGDIIYYQLIRDKNGKFRAINAQIEGLENQLQTKQSTNSFIWLALGLVLLLSLGLGGFYYYQ